MRFKGLFDNFDETKNQPDIEKLKVNNPRGWKKLQKQFRTGRQIVQTQVRNGLDRVNEKILRSYLDEYVSRMLKFGLNSFPTSFNVLEPFFTFNTHNSILQLVEEEESYGVSLEDFLEFVTHKEFNLENIDFIENINEEVIYHFSFSSGFEEIIFNNSNGKAFVIGSLSLVRRGSEVSMLIQAGEMFNSEDAEEYFKDKTRESIEKSISPHKKSLGLEIDQDGEPKVVNCFGRDDLWLHSVAILFDLENKTLDIRNISRDENISYHVITDDFNAIFSRESSTTTNKILETVKNYFGLLAGYEAVFDFAKYCLALPYYVFENEKRVVEVIYPTELNSLISGPFTKRKFSSVPNGFKIFAKPFYFLESQDHQVLETKEISDESFKVEKSGYWKRIEIDEEGYDKKGKPVMGKTWVERNDIYYSTPKGITTTEQIPVFEDEEAGYIYIMRQPTHEEGIFKIGLTQRNPEIRKKELSNTSNADKFFVINKYYTRNCFEAEKRIHENLKNYRLTSRREFFKCDLKLILNECEIVTNKINETLHNM